MVVLLSKRPLTHVGMNDNSTLYNLTSVKFNLSSDSMTVTQYDLPYAVYCAKIAVVSAVSVLIVLSNVTNIYVLSRKCHIPKISKIFLLNLSISDLFVGLISCIPTIVPSVTGYWPYGSAWCQIAGIVHGTSVTISIWSISMISIDRFLAICKPMTYASWRSSRKAYGVIVCLWTLAIATFFSPLPTKQDFVYYHYSFEENICGLYWEYKWFCVITAVYIPVLSGGILVFTNVKIMKKILYRKQHLDKINCRSSMPRRGLNAVKMLLMTSSIYFLAWGPYVTEVVLISFVDSIQVPGLVRFITMWLANSNSFINVFIFSFVYRSFRHEVKLLVSRCFFCCQRISILYHKAESRTDNTPSEPEPEIQVYQRENSMAAIRAEVYVFNCDSFTTSV